ncbi:hypothetical protein BDM02DRAFT_3190878 [Thelephora ganbajun]|uniref:Uncharacterized protein n=1 Tax=Thelephora ganbajun TaxID=370292 RepID=A0ACB6Z4P4_THEGA|nr:hypothetical protein BDM02DRAFT_3190878 [Thelephora ganbajun]
MSDPSREITVVPRDPSLGQAVEVSSLIVKPVVHRSAWVGPYVDVPLSSIKSRKHRQRERLQHALEAKALHHPEVPSSSIVLDKSTSNKDSPSEGRALCNMSHLIGF